MIKTVWVDAYNQQKGKWEEYEEPTGEMKKGIFGGDKPVMEKKKRWIWLDNQYHDHLIDGQRLSRDLEEALNELESTGFTIVSVNPVISGRYDWQGYGTSSVASGSAPTAVSWGYSLTEGMTIIARKP
jgi:hypothetical protein